MSRTACWSSIALAQEYPTNSAAGAGGADGSVCLRVGRKRFDTLSTDERVAMGNARLSSAALWKMLAFAGLVALPLATVGVANYHTFEGVHDVAACGRCHHAAHVSDIKDASRIFCASGRGDVSCADKRARRERACPAGTPASSCR